MEVRRRGGEAGLVVLGLVLGWFARPLTEPDYQQFARAGGALLAGRWHQVYDSSAIQAGPFEQALLAVLHGLDRLLPVWLGTPGNDVGPGLSLFVVLGVPASGSLASSSVPSFSSVWAGS